MPPVPKPVVIHDPAYLRWVRETQRCRVEDDRCNYTFARPGPNNERMVEPNHLRTRSDDSCVIPLCAGHHRTNTVSWHNGQETFCREYGTTKEELIHEAEMLYHSYKEGK